MTRVTVHRWSELALVRLRFGERSRGEKLGSEGEERKRSGHAGCLALSSFIALFAVMVIPAVAGAATHSAKVTNISVSPSLAGHTGFGLDHFDVGAVNTGDTFAYPFTTGSKIGHCVEATLGMANDLTATLRTDGDLSLDNSDAQNAIGAGFTPGAQRVEWILLDSYKTSPSDSSGVEGAAHQSAIWQLTNPSSGNAVKITGASTNEQNAAARATQLLGDSAVHFASVNNAADLSIDGGAALHTCAGTSRTVTVTGSPWTDASLTLTGAGVFHASGGASTTINLGASGTAQVQIDSTGPGQVDVTANVKIATMVQADNGGNQDFVYLEFQTIAKNVSIVFNNCQNLTLSATAVPGFTRAYTWTITKKAEQTSVTTSSDSATLNYTVVVTKSSAIDSGWQVSGTITVANANAYTVDNVQVNEQGVDNGGTCVLNGTGAIGSLDQGQTASVGYTCTYAAGPSPSAGTNTATVAWTLPTVGGSEAQTLKVSQSFAFGDPTTTVHDSVNVADSFDGAIPAIVAGGADLNASKTFTYSRTVTVPATSCRTYDNTATITPTDTPTSPNGASTSVQVCRQSPPVAATSIRTTPRTAISLTKRASSPTVKAGGIVSFTILWTNTGKADARNVVICDELPSQMTFVSAKGSTFRSGKACWTRKSVAKGATLTFHVVARVDADAGDVKLVNVATATASNAKPARATAPVHVLRNELVRAAGVTG